jgi:hypothetical protein
MDVFAQFIPILLLSIPFAFGNFFLAKRLNKNPNLWAIVSLIPIVNFWLLIRITYLLIYKILDTLEQIKPTDQ